MKRMTYVDKEGNAVDQSLENRRPLLRFFFVIGTIIPFIIIIFIIVKMVENNNCINIYSAIKKASLNYIKDENIAPTVEGDDIKVNIGRLYNKEYLKSSSTNNTLCSGTVKITKYKKEYVYTLDVKNCNKCSVNEKYGSWSTLQNAYPKNKAIVDVIPYYNYYDREINLTKWSKYFDEEELSDEKSEYGINLPLDMDLIPEIPKEGKIVNIENDTTYYYRYQDLSWKWYDIVGNYSDFSSEMPDGFSFQDKDTMIYTDWSDYSTDYPEEKSYREINQTTGYKFYYLNKSNEKVYYNNGKYTAREEVNTEKYNKTDSETYTLYHYRDRKWRWYNGQKRKYSSFSSKMPNGRPYKDAEIQNLNNPSSWESERHTDAATQEYRLEEKKLMTRFRTQYEILSLKVLPSPIERKEFEKKVNDSLINFAGRSDKKLETTYKFRYRKS